MTREFSKLRKFVLDRRRGISHLLLLIGYVSLAIELLFSNYSVPSTVDPRLQYYPILSYLGRSEPLLGVAMTWSAVFVFEGAILFRSKRVDSLNVIVSSTVMGAGAIMFAYGFNHPVLLNSPFGLISVQPYALGSGLTFLAGFILFLFAVLSLWVQQVKPRSSRKKVGLRKSTLDPAVKR